MEVAAASHQHTGRLAAAVSGAPGAPRLRTARCGRALEVCADTATFVSTLLPRHRHIIGADPKLVRAVGEVLFDMSRYYTSAGMVCAPSDAQQSNCLILDIEDEEPVRILWQTLRDDASLRDRLRMSPLQFVRAASNVIVLEQDDIEQRSAHTCPWP